MANRITEEQREQAFAMFGNGASTNEVAKQLFKKYWVPAKKLRNEYDAQSGDGEAANELAPIDDPEEWDLTVKLPTARMDQILLRLSSQEKADAIAAVLTARLSAEA